MSLILAEGFDFYGYSTTAWLADSRWSRDSENTHIRTTNGRRSGPCLSLEDTNNSNALTYYWTYLNLASAYSTIICGFAYYATNSANPPTGNFPILLFQKTTGSSIQCVIHRTSADGLQVRATAGGTLLGETAEGVVTPGAYQYWEIKIVCHESAGSVIIKIDGVEVLNISDVNTRTAGSGGIQYIHFRKYNANGTDHTRIDDLIVMDDQGSSFNDFLGDVAVIGHLPVADGADADWTSTLENHYDSINDVGNGYATNYIESATVAQKDSFTIIPDSTYPSILAVEVPLHGLNTGAGTAKVKPYVKISDTIYYGSELTLPAGSSDKRAYTWEGNPATGGLWSRAVVAAAEFGYEVTEIT